MEVKKMILWFLVWFGLFLITPRPTQSTTEERSLLELPSIRDIFNKEVARIKQEQAEIELEVIRTAHKEEQKRLEEEKKQREKAVEVVSRGVNLEGRKYKVEKLIVTAYAPYDNKSGICNDGNPNTTSTGTKPDWGTVAVNPKRFPYGTEFYIEGYGFGKGLDTGGAMRKNSNKIDIYMDTYEQAINWGKREIGVIIFEDNK